MNAGYWDTIASKYNVSSPSGLEGYIGTLQNRISGLSQLAGYWAIIEDKYNVKTPAALESLIGNYQTLANDWSAISSYTGCTSVSCIETAMSNLQSKVKAYTDLENSLPIILSLSESNARLGPYSTNHYSARLTSNGIPLVNHPVTLYRPDTGKSHGTVITDTNGVATFEISYVFAGAYVYQAKTIIARLKNMEVYSNPVGVTIVSF